MKAIQGKRALIVGIFITIGIIILMATVFTLGGQKKTFAHGIPIRAVFTDVNGLQAGNNIWFSGVKVGAVRRLQLIGGAKVEVVMNIDIKSRDFIREDAKVKIASDGLIGNKIIIIYGGTQATPAVKPNDLLQDEAVPGTDQMMNTLQENNKNLLAITSDFKAISHRLADGEGTLGALLTNDDLMKQLQATAMTLQKASANIQMLTSNVSDYTAKLQSKGVLANELVTDTSLFKSLQSTAAQMQAASNNARTLTDNLKEVSEKIKDSTNTVGILMHDQQTANNIRATVENLQTGTQKFDENMEALQHNFLFRGFFRKKAKREKEQQRKETAVKNNNPD